MVINTGMIYLMGGILAAILAGLILAFMAYAFIAGARAYRETQARQRRWHPDPEAERAQIAELRRMRARGERAQVEHRINHDRRQGAKEAKARAEYARSMARKIEVQRAAEKAAGAAS